MRDPGTPGRNPFFDHGPEPEIGEPDRADAPGEDPFGSDRFDLGGGGSDPLGALAALIDALQGAQPEATEHLVAAAHELILAVKTVVDATEAVLAAQRGVPRPDARSADPTDESERDPFASDEPPTSAPTSGVRKIDLA